MKSIWAIGFLIICGVTSTARGTVKSQTALGLGLTNNANLTPSSPQSDSYWRLDSSHTFSGAQLQTGIRAKVLRYSGQIHNDLMAWKLPVELVRPFYGHWLARAEVFGNHYYHGAAGTTDSSFNNMGLGLSAENPSDATSELLWNWGPSYELRRYLELNNRTDHTLSAWVEADYDWTSWVFSGRGELGLLASSDSLYTRSFFDLNFRAEYIVATGWELATDFTMRLSTFLNRNVDQSTTVSKQKGASVTRVSTVKESQTWTRLSFEAIKDLGSDWQAAASLCWTGQTTTSGLDDYAATELFFKVGYHY